MTPEESPFSALGGPDIIRHLSNFFYFIRNKRILIIGAGGGGDVCGCLPTYRWLQELEAFPILGTLTWERTEVFNDFGPRTFDQIDGLFKQVGTVAWGNENTKIRADGTPFQASRIAGVLHEAVVFLDISKGVPQLAKDLTEFITTNNIDFVLALDVGGDILTKGTEPGLQSPLADAMTLATLFQLKCPKAVGVFGLNCDGELTLTELEKYLFDFNREDKMFGQRVHTRDEVTFMEQVIQQANAVTEASYQPIRYLRGERGEVTIRNGKRSVILDEVITHTFFLRIEEIYYRCPLAPEIEKANSIEEASEILLKQGIISELELEKRNLQGK